MSTALPKSDQRGPREIAESIWADLMGRAGYSAPDDDVVEEILLDWTAMIAVGFASPAERAAQQVAEEQALYARERRERMATAFLAGMLANSKSTSSDASLARVALNAADVLIEMIDQTAGARP